MSFSSSSYGAAAVGGSATGGWYTFFPDALHAPDVLYEARLSLGQNTGSFSVFTEQGSEAASGNSGVVFKIYTANDPDETPQLQVTQEGNGQNVIPAALFITVTALVDGVIWAGGQSLRALGRLGS